MSRHAVIPSSPKTPRAARGEALVGWLRELNELHQGGLITDEDFALLRAEQLDELLSPPRCVWTGRLLGMLLMGAAGTAGTWWLSQDWRHTAAVGALSALWGVLSLGRVLREKLIELQLRNRRRVLLALLEEDLIDSNEFADFDEVLVSSRPRFQ